MSNKTIAERIVDAYHAGKDAIFHTNDVASTGSAYLFTPDGLSDYIAAESGYITEVVTSAELTSAGGNLTIPAGSTLDEAIQLIIDAVDPVV